MIKPMKSNAAKLQPYWVSRPSIVPRQFSQSMIVIAKDREQAITIARKRTVDTYKSTCGQEPLPNSKVMQFRAFAIDMNHPHIVAIPFD